MHPHNALLSWAPLSTEDVNIADEMCVPTGRTAMVNMRLITHDPQIWILLTNFAHSLVSKKFDWFKRSLDILV
jgi:hypothetical protein